MSRQRLKTLIKITVSLSLLLFLLRTVGFEAILSEILTANVSFFALAVAIYLVTLAVRSYRWQILLRAQDMDVPLHRLIYLYFAGSFFNIVLPSGFGGDVVKYYELSRHNPDEEANFRARVASSVLADRISGMIVLLMMGTATVPLALDLLDSRIILLITGLTVAGVGGLFVILNVQLRRWLEAQIPGLQWLLRRRGIKGLYASLEGYTWPALLRVSLVSFVFNILIIGMNVALGLTFGVNVSLTYYLIFIPIISVLLAIPLSINGFGIREGGYVFLFTQAGVAQSQAISMSLGFGAVVIITGLVGGLLYLANNLLSLGAPQEVPPSIEEPL